MPAIEVVKPHQTVLRSPPCGHTASVRVSDIAALPVRLGAAVRRRVFHPEGVLAEGILERVAAPDHRQPPPDLSSCGPWDVLLASTLAGSRFLLAPAVSWPDATFSSLMPLRYRGGVWWVRARVVSDIASSGLSLSAMRDEIDAEGVEFAIEQSAGTGDFAPLARLTLRFVDPSRDDIAFDPVLHTADDVRLIPEWLNDFRRSVYRRNREGRGPE